MLGNGSKNQAEEVVTEIMEMTNEYAKVPFIKFDGDRFMQYAMEAMGIQESDKEYSAWRWEEAEESDEEIQIVAKRNLISRQLSNEQKEELDNICRIGLMERTDSGYVLTEHGRELVILSSASPVSFQFLEK